MKIIHLTCIALFFVDLISYPNAALAQTSQVSSRQDYRAISKIVDQLRPLAVPLPESKEGDWLKTHQEQKQSFRDFVESEPVTLNSTRRRLYVQPMGEFDDATTEIANRVTEFLGIYFQCEVVHLQAMDLSSVPDDFQRIDSANGALQLRTDYLLKQKLLPALPNDGVAILGLTNIDLWPGGEWNFVFGQAMYRERVGVWSLNRLVSKGDETSQRLLTLTRALKVASHETGHMFSIPHCVIASCNMQGSNSLYESDQQPLHLCPECTGKVLYATKAEAMRRFIDLHEFCKKHGLPDAAYYQQAITKLK